MLILNISILYDDYSLTPEKVLIPYDIQLHYCKKIADEYEVKVDDIRKLISNLDNKTNYALYYKNLLLYLSSGMKLTKIHRVLKFKQCD